MTIHILSEEVAIKIAAGEVVERPLSVVKELIENSIDAAASEIIIKVNRAGRDLIEVADNGSGISVEDMKIAVQRHATSKIQNIEDLNYLSSLGFRGEALASIAAVSHFTMQSHAKSENEGTLLRMEGGKLIAKKIWGGPEGTIIRVENLFFNTPARLKFQKQELTEKRAIIGLIQKYAFEYAGIRFFLTMDDKTILQTSGNGNRRQVLSIIFNIDQAKQMILVDYKDGGFQVNGFTSPIGLTRSNRKEINFFVNGRWILDSSLSAALIQAYHTFLMVGRFPMAILDLKMPLEEVDVNVHPAKAEVRFRNPGFIFSLVQRAVRQALIQSNPPAIDLADSIIGANRAHSVDFAWTLAKDTKGQNDFLEQTPNSVENLNSLPSKDEFTQVPLLRVIGQIAATYLVAEGPDGLYLIDQHAAHERILFEKFNRLTISERARQQLLNPVTLQLNAADFILLQPLFDVLDKLGFDIEEFGFNTIRVRSIPSFFAQSDPIVLLKTCIENFEENESPLGSDLEQKIIARICKRSAVRGGQILSHQEQLQLIQDLEQCQSPRTCPHGRPTMIHLSVDLLERQFGRRGSQ